MTGNNIQSIQDCQSELTNIKNFISKDPLGSMVRYLVSYSVIKSCGTIEIVFKDIIYNHLIKNANQEAIAYFSKNVKESSSNPKIDNICSLLKQINVNWNTSFKSKATDIDKQSLNSLVELRNQLAHGNSITSSIDDVITYFTCGCNILQVLDSIVK
jgi:hypothetical protein